MKEKSFFIVIDGIDGCGSSTHCRILSAFLENEGYKVYLTREPSDNEVGQLTRKLLKDKSIPAATDALLFAADRSLHYHNEIKEKLDEGFIVISDRYLESSIVYQSLQSEEISIDWVKELNKSVGLPDLTIILDINPKISISRKDENNLEKFEDTSFLDKVRNLFLARAKQEGYHIINSDDIIELVQEQVQDIVIKKLK